MQNLSPQNGQATATNGTSGSACPVESGHDRSVLMEQTVDLLIVKAKSGELWPELYERALRVLESLPLPTGNFSLAARRLQNALRYTAEQEFGAAAFELRMLRGQLAA